MSKTVLITGASSGIGKATAELFYERGWNVAATMRTPESDESLDRVAHIRLDVTDLASIKQAVDEAIKRFGSIDAVVNNAGYGMVGPFEAATPEQIERQFQTNVFGLMNVTREILPYFRERRAGVILNVSSMGGRITFPLYSVYHATKWAVEGFSESLQFEVRPFNIRVKIIEPGPIKTDFYDRSMDVVSRPGLTAYNDFVKRAFPNMQRAGEKAPPGDVVAKVIYRAATDQSWKMRYPANASMILSLRRILPLSIFTGIVRRAVLR